MIARSYVFIVWFVCHGLVVDASGEAESGSAPTETGLGLVYVFVCFGLV